MNESLRNAICPCGGMRLVDIIQIEGYKNSSQAVNRYPFHAKIMRWQLKIVGQV